METYIFLSLMSYSLNMYLNYINKLLMTKILHGCLNGIGTVPSNEKNNALICQVRRISIWLTHLHKNRCFTQFAFFYTYVYYSHCYYSHCLKWSQWSIDSFNRSFLTETVHLMSEMECNFFAKPLLITWWLHFQEIIFILGPKVTHNNKLIC